MKLSVKGSRIALLVANLAFAVGLLVHYAYNMFPDVLNGVAPWLFPHHTEASSVSLVDVSTLRGDGGLVVERKNSAQTIAPVATWVQPRKRPPPPPPPTPKDPGELSSTTPEPTAPGEPIEGGPLAEQDWTYAGGMINVDDPSRSFVVLRKKPPEAEAGNTSRPTRSTFGARRTTRVIGSRRVPSAARAGGDDEPIWLHVSRREFIDEERDLHFWVDSASTERFVYWTDSPKRMYALPVDRESPYYNAGRNEGKLLAQKEPEEDPEKAPEPGRGGFVKRAPGYENLREEEYRHIVASGSKEAARGLIQPTRIQGVRPSQPEASSVPPRIQPRGAPEVPENPEAQPTPADGAEAGNEADAANPPPAETPEEAAKKLGSVLKDARANPNLSEEDRKGLDEIEKMVLEGKK